MNIYRRNVTTATQLCAFVLVMLTFVTSARAETVVAASEKRATQSAFQGEDDITPPPMPQRLQVTGHFKLFLVGHAVGTQNYVCRPVGTGFGFALFTPQATLFDDEGQQIITHFFSPNPKEANTDQTVVANFQIRATWQDSQDTSSVWAKLDQSATFATDPAFVAPDAIAWLLLDMAGTQPGPTGGGTLAATQFVQRLNTHGGLAPSTGCASSTDVGHQAFVPYTADYLFYKKADEDE